METHLLSFFTAPSALAMYLPPPSNGMLTVAVGHVLSLSTFPISAERAFPSQRTFETYRFLVNRAVTALKVLIGDGNAAVPRLVTSDNDALGIGEVTDA